MKHDYNIKFPDHDKEIKFTADNESGDEIMTSLISYYKDDRIIISRSSDIFDGIAGSDESYNALAEMV